MRSSVGSAQISRGGLESVEDGHADVHQDHVREGAPSEVDRLAAGARGAGDLHVVLRVDQRCESVADRGLVVGDEDADHRLGLVGQLGMHAKPVCRVGPASSVPPIAVARSRIPAIPIPGFAPLPFGDAPAAILDIEYRQAGGVEVDVDAQGSPRRRGGGRW